MKLTFKQFKVKSAYFMPFIRAWYLYQLGKPIYRLSIFYVDGSSYHSYCSLIFYSLSNRPSVKNASFILLDQKSYFTELQFFVSFLVSCNLRQLVVFLDDMFDSVFVFPDVVSAGFLKVLPQYIGEKRFRYYLNHTSKFF